VAGRKLPPERVRVLLDYLAAGLNPRRAVAAAGVSHGFAYGLHHKMGGVYRIGSVPAAPSLSASAICPAPPPPTRAR
jgi:hypothetical protein